MTNRLLKSEFFKSLLVAVIVLTTMNVSAQSGRTYWQPLTMTKNNDAVVVENKRNLAQYKLYELDVNGIKEALVNAPKRNAANAETNNIVYFPDADGSIESYRVFETSNMEPALAAAYPEIKSYVGKGIDDPTAIIYFSLSPLGLQTMLVRADKPAVFIEPYTTDRSSYAVYRKSDKSPSAGTFECRLINNLSETINAGSELNRPNADDGNYRTFRLALSVTGEYTVYFGGTRALALAAMNNTMTRVNGVFEIDFGVHMNLIANDTILIYTSAAGDPYSNASSGAGGAWNQELQTNLTNMIGNSGYDVGHLFGASGGGGNAGCIACVCVNPTGPSSLKKGSGFTSPADGIPMGDNFDIDYVAHEMGHQFGGNHTFTFSNEGTIAQVEPGSGSTIMGYAGITGSTDVQPHSDAYFSAISIQQITNYVKSTTCQVTMATGNAVPTADAGLDYTIPRGTPFALTGVGTDANDVGLTYCWEQMNTGTSATTFPSINATTGAAFRSYTPVSSPVHYFPRLTTIQAGATSWTWEAVPNVARTMNFRFTVRDNHAGGPANNSDDMIVTVSTVSGPFSVSAPNTAVSWAGGSSQTVTWIVANTTVAPVSCANVKISLSTDGGNTFPTVLLASTANDGTESITVPNIATTQARIKVEAVGNIFFDMSNVNFTITASVGLTTITTSTISPLNYCAGAAVSVPFTTNSAANAGNIFRAQLSDASGSFANPDTIGSLSSTAAGTIAAVIPAGKATGTGYRIRVVSSNPLVTGSTNVSNITISAQVGAAGGINGLTNFCAWLPVQFSIGAVANATNYTWSVPPGATITNGQGSTQITVAFTNAVTTGNISVFGSNANCTGTSSTLPISILATPNIPSTSDAFGCSGKPITLTGSPAGGSWSVANPYTGPSTTFYYTVTNGTTGCSASSMLAGGLPNNITVNPSPAPSITGNNPFCAGNSATLNAGAGFTNYLWSTGATTQTINVSTAATFTVTVTNASGCSGSTSATTTVNPLPTVSFSGLAASYNVGAAAATLTGSPVGGVFSGPGISGNTFTPSVAGVGGPYNITYLYTNGNGCSNSSIQQTSVTNCTPPARPGTISTTGGTAKVCPGDSKTYSVPNVAGATSYTWTPPAGGTITNGQGTRIVIINYTAGFTANDSLRVVSNNACGSSISRALLISRNNPATPSVITGATYGVCNLNGVPYSVTNVAGMTYNWSFSVANATIASGSGTNSVTANFLPAYTTGLIRVSATNACGTGALRTLTVRATPATPASIAGSATACANQAGVPYSTAPIASATNYTWSVPSGARINDGTVTSTSTTLVTTATAVTVNFATTAGNVRVRANNACGVGTYRSLAVTFNCRSGEQSVSDDLNLTCYPMPASNQLNISYVSAKDQTGTIRLVDIIGKTLVNQNINSAKGENKFVLDLSSIAKGIYLVDLTNGNQKSLQKIVIE